MRSDIWPSQLCTFPRYWLAMPTTKMKRSQAPIPEHVLEMKNMNRGMQQNELSETSIARAMICKGKAIMGTDGSTLCKTQLLLTPRL
jgi:hypothetical protein